MPALNVIMIISILKKLAELFGFSLIITKKFQKGAGYEQVSPFAFYAPWLTDRQFRNVYEVIKDYTLVDKYRCYELWQLVSQTAGLKGALIEIGVWKGGSGALIAQQAKLVGISDTVYLCDTFTGVVKAGKKDSVYKGGEHADASEKTVNELLNKLKLKNSKILTGVFPEGTSKLVKDKIFRFCHIDVDVYQSAKDIMDWIWPKLVVGGMVVFDDYGFRACAGITRLVNEERGKQDRLIIHNLNGHAVMIKTKKSASNKL